MMICLFALGFTAFAIVNGLVVVSVADHLSRTTQSPAPTSRKDDVLGATKLVA